MLQSTGTGSRVRRAAEVRGVHQHGGARGQPHRRLPWLPFAGHAAGLAHALGDLAALFLAARDEGEMRGAGPGDLDRHRATCATRAQHDHTLALQRRDLGDRLHHALAVVVVADQAAALDRDVVRGADRAHVVVDLVEQRDDGDLPWHGDAHAAIAERAQRLHRQREVRLVGEVVLPELSGQAMMREDRVEHAVDGVLGDGVAKHAGHLLLWGNGGGGRFRHGEGVSGSGWWHCAFNPRSYMVA